MALCKLWKHLAEDQIGKIGGDAFLVEPAFLDSALVERPHIGRPGEKGLATEDKCEHFQPVAALGFGEGEQTFIVAGDIKQ